MNVPIVPFHCALLCIKGRPRSAQSRLNVAESEDAVQEYLIHSNLLGTISSQDQIRADLT